MPSRFLIFMLVIVSIVFVVDLYSYKALYLIFNNKPYFRYIKIINWSILPAVLISIIFSNRIVPFENSAKSMYYIYFFTGILITFFIPKLIFSSFHLIEDLYSSVSWLTDYCQIKIFHIKDISTYSRVTIITRIGLVFFGVFFLLFLKGMIFDRFNYRINEKIVTSKNIPTSFNNLKVVQISDLHIGCYYNNDKKLEKAVKQINDLKPDIILFTGDMVINLANELEGFKDILNKLEAKYGKYSILGNHDYGEYYNWKSENDKIANLERLIKLEKEAGFDIMLNENRIIKIKDDSIAIIGIENWGLPPFPQYGDLKKAMNGTEGIPFKILLSHDPSHWDVEVKELTDIDLTLSGHTHGMQFGIFTHKIRWSPIKLKYKKWAGLYSYKNQHLYVNVGLGSIGYPGRVAMRPEITLFRFKNI